LGQIESADALVEDEIVDKSLSTIIHRILKVGVRDHQDETSSSSYQQQKKSLQDTLISLTSICLQFLEKTSVRQFTFLSALNKIVDVGLVYGFFKQSKITIHTSGFKNCFATEDDIQTTEDAMEAGAALNSANCRKKTDVQLDSKNSLENAFCSIPPDLLIESLRKAVEVQCSEVNGSKRSYCTPSNRLRRCWKHCSQILVARLILFLCNFKRFLNQISGKIHLKKITELLDPTLDPQLLCILLQMLAMIAMNPFVHQVLTELQIDDVLIQLLLPADDWYYTNHSTKYAHFVKQHAARILVYIGLGDRDIPNEDEYIQQTCGSTSYKQTNSLSAISVEGLLQRTLAELEKLTKNADAESTLFKGISKEGSLDSATLGYWNGFVTKITFGNLSEYLTMLSLIVDSELLLRLHLHKLSWDLNLVVKRRLSNINSTGTSSVEQQAGDKKRRESSAFQMLGRGLKLNYEINIRRCRSERVSRIDSETKQNLRRIKLKPRIAAEVAMNSILAQRGKKTSLSSPSVRHLPKYLQNLFRSRLGTDPSKISNRHAAETSSGSMTSSSEAAIEFTRTLQNYPLARREALRLKHRPERSLESPEPLISDTTDDLRNTSIPEIDVYSTNLPGSPDWNPLGSATTSHRRLSMELCINAAINCLAEPSRGLPLLPMIEVQRPSIMSTTCNGPFGAFISTTDSTNFMYLCAGDVQSQPPSRNSSFNLISEESSLDRQSFASQYSFTIPSWHSSQLSELRQPIRTARTSFTSDTTFLFPYDRELFRRGRTGSGTAPTKSLLLRHQSALSLDSADKIREVIH
uniref:Ubiquitinyl hydrolase 1 n=1 Tax=Gongylonema pulchrum TaxID=637853 RepID=A0A183CUY7_9BILA